MLNRFLIILLLFFLPNNAHASQSSIREEVLDYTLDVFFDLQDSKVSGIGTIPVKKGQELKLNKGRFNLLQVSLDQEKIDIYDRNETVRILPSRDGLIEIKYEGIFESRGHPFTLPGEEVLSVIGADGIFLIGAWYPKPDQLCLYHLSVTLPEGYEAVSEGEKVERITKNQKTIFTFDFPHPLDGINLIATDRYKIAKDHFNGVDIFTYFFQEDEGLAETYIEHTKKYIKLYGDLINPFPYKRFTIVENFLPTGFSMPTYTVLGQDILRLPFIPETSLGHEILHQWFGNLVYIDERGGNWAEGLTTFLADHLYEEEKGRGFGYRKGVLVDYQSYVNDKNEFPLKDFIERTDEASKAMGYGKALMVFQMLKKMVGEAEFYDSIREFTAKMRFRKATWDDIKRAFEKYYHEDLTWFFNQWIDEKGLADFSLEEVEVKPSGAKFEVAFTVVQKRKVFILDFSAAVSSDFGKTTQVFHLQREKERFEMIVDDLPQKIVLDEEYDVARRLSLSEFPPVLARLMGDEEPIIALPLSGPGIYGDVIRTFGRRGAEVRETNRITLEDLKTHSIVILGADNPLIARLYGCLVAQGGFSVVIKEIPWNRWKVAGIFDARSEEEVNAAFQKIFHYGKYSVLSFDHGVNISKKIDESGRGITQGLYEEPVAVDVSTLNTLSDVMDRVVNKRIIYIGETHDQFSHHVMELEIIKDLYRRGKNVAIGMEMFQRPFQKVLDEYIEGKMDEKEFLRKTEYFKRWGFDYNLYRPILQFARSGRIPVVALNMRQEIVDKVFRGGFNSLSKEEKESVPSQMDYSDDAYKERLKKIFQEHEDVSKSNFDFFYQAQILWDETMSESVDRFLKAHPNDQMVVLAGSEHIAYGSGIPKRTARRNGYSYGIILNDVNVKRDIADYILFPGVIPGTRSPKLMVFLTEDRGKVEIKGFPPASISEKAGMEVGDILLAIDHAPIHSIDDVKIELVSREKGAKIKVRIFRRSLLGGDKEMDFELVL